MHSTVLLYSNSLFGIIAFTFHAKSSIQAQKNAKLKPVFKKKEKEPIYLFIPTKSASWKDRTEPQH